MNSPIDHIAPSSSLNTDIELVKSQLKQLYKGIDSTFDHRQNVKKWCLSVWLAILYGIFSKKIGITFPFDLMLVTFPVCIFWFHEGIIAQDAILLHERAMRLEQYLLSRDFQRLELVTSMYITGRYEVSLRKKFWALIRGLFILETVYFFYIALLAMSVFAILYFR